MAVSEAFRMTGTPASPIAGCMILLGLAALVALGGSVWSSARAVALSAPFIAAVWIGLATLWTIVGVTYLIDRRKPRKTQTHQDYRYGLTFMGVQPNFLQRGVGNGGIQFSIVFNNYSPGPVRYVLEDVGVHIGTRSIPKYKTNTLIGYMARGATRTIRPTSFSDADIQEYYGKGNTMGTLDFSLCYGSLDDPPIRRLRMSLDLYLTFPPDGVGAFGYADAITAENDEAISTRE